MPEHFPTLSRRTVVVGGAALGAGIVVAGCAGGPASEVARPTAGTPLGPVSDVPVGSAKIFDAQGVVVTQATAGTYTGFSTVCPHQGCAVATVQGAHIVCPCHGSTFGLDGHVEQGPAPKGLTPQAVTVTGSRISVA
jgi:Rieske Fe-S protein